MVFERFTERSRQVVVLAQDEARMLNHDHIGTAHLLLGLMREEAGVAARVLHETGLDVVAVREQVRGVIGEGNAAFGGQIPFSPGAKAALEAGLRESLSVGHNFIGTEHILLGLIREPEPQLAAVLAGAGADIDDLVARIERALPTRSIVEMAPDILGFERYTEFARRAVIELAQDEVRLLTHNYVGTEHLLLGLLREEQGGAARALGELGIELDPVREHVRQIVGVGDEPIFGDVPFTPRARKVLALAREEATALNHVSVGTEHVLLGLALVRDGVAARVLERLGVDPERVRATVLRLLHDQYEAVAEASKPPSHVDMPCPACGATLAHVELSGGPDEAFNAAREGVITCPSCGRTYDLRYSIEWRPS
jgi:ATP-dependent Clp protease ATP-binding subunit ClpA